MPHGKRSRQNIGAIERIHQWGKRFWPKSALDPTRLRRFGIPQLIGTAPFQKLNPIAYQLPPDRRTRERAYPQRSYQKCIQLG